MTGNAIFKDLFRNKRAIISMVLLLALVFSLSALTFAWYQNYVDIKGTSLTTGKVSLEINGYGADESGNVTPMTPMIINGETEGSVVIDSAVTRIDTWNKSYHVYYFIKNPKTDTSIDIDASVSVSLDNGVIDDKLGGITVDINQVKTEAMTGKMSDIEGLTESQIIDAISQGAQNVAGESDGVAFNNLENAYHELSIPVGEYVCLRLTYNMPNNLATYTDIDLGVRVSFCLAQKDGLPGAVTYSEYVVYSLSGLQSALAKYRPNDKIVIKGDIMYEGDLIITRPMTLELQNAKLDIKGNLLYAYAYEGRFAINTKRGGSIAVYKRTVEQFDEDGELIGTLQLGGDFDISTPLSQMELTGKGSTSLALADIYVEGDFHVSASMSNDNTPYTQGLIIDSAAIRSIDEERGDTDGFKDIILDSTTAINIMMHTEVGKISSSSSIVEIENRGTVAEIDLQYMPYDNYYTASNPQILINNYGTVRSGSVSLPINWAEKFVSNGDGTYSGNTRIISQPGAGRIIVSPATNHFVSDGSGNPATDHIEYVKLDTFAEMINGKQNEVIIQYTGETGLYLKGTSTDIGSSLKNLVDYYSGVVGATEIANSTDASNVSSSLMISPAEELTYLKIICYSTSLTEEDYAFIRSMTGLVTLDLSDAQSLDKRVPADAFNGMSRLENVSMSKLDYYWGKNIFKNTGVDEIRLTDSLTETTSETFTGIKYIHTASRMVKNVTGGGRLVFVPDATTFSSYLSGNAGMVFYDAERYVMDTGDYFLRLDADTKKAEFVAFNPSKYAYGQFDAQSELLGDAKFDFNTITVNGEVYSVTAYGTYSFYGKTFVSVNRGELVIGSNTENIETYAFGSVKGFNTITINGDVRIDANAFRSMTVNQININDVAIVGNNAFSYSTAVKIHAPNIIETGTNSFSYMTNLVSAYMPSLRVTNEPFYSCKKIFRLDVGVFVENTKFGSQCGDIRHIFIHTDSTDDPSRISYTLSFTGAGSNDSRVLFVPSDFAKIYQYYGVKINIGNVDIANIKEYYDPGDENIVGTVKQPNLYYLDNLDGTAVILRYLKSVPKSTTDIFAVSKNDGSGEYYRITELSEYSYQGTTVNRDTLTFPESITKVNNYAFAGSNKVIGELDLCNVTYVGANAFEYNKTVTVKGDKVNFMGDYAFRSNTNLLLASFKSLRKGEKSRDYGYYFVSCSNLRVAYLGPMDEGVRDWIFYQCSKLKYVIVDATDRKAGASVPGSIASGTSAIFLVISDTSRGFPNERLVKPNLSNIYVNGSETYSISVNGKEYSIQIPISFFHVDSSGTAELLKYSAKKVEMERYTIPNMILGTGETANYYGLDIPTCTEHTGTVENGILLKRLGGAAYSGVDFGDTIFNTGMLLTTIESGTLSGLNAVNLELENVETVGRYAFDGSSVKTVVANKLKKIVYGGFAHCNNLKEIYLPAIERLEQWSFWASGIESVTLGENLSYLSTGEFADCQSLTEVVLLSPKKINLPSNVFVSGSWNKTKEKNVHLVVREEFREQYVSEWGTKLGSIDTFENSYTDSQTGLTYFYSTVTGNFVELSFFRAAGTLAFGSTYTIPSQFVSVDAEGNEQTYTVTRLGNMIFEQIGNQTTVETLILPSGLNTLSQNIEFMPKNIRAFVIDGSNEVYKTLDGVIYSKDGSVLLFYPRAKTDSDFTLPSAVQSVADGAFAENEFLRRVICNQSVIFADDVFYNCVILSEVRFTSVTPSQFIGINTFERCNSALKIYVPAESVDEYRSAIIFDSNARDKVTPYTE